jgi:hypothetical protein
VAFAPGPDGSVFACFKSDVGSVMGAHLARWDAPGATRGPGLFGRVLGGADRPDSRTQLSVSPDLLAVSPDGQVLVGLVRPGDFDLPGCVMHCWDANTLEEVAVLTSSPKFDRVGFSADGRFLYLRATDGPRRHRPWPGLRAALNF